MTRQLFTKSDASTSEVSQIGEGVQQNPIDQKKLSDTLDEVVQYLQNEQEHAKNEFEGIKIIKREGNEEKEHPLGELIQKVKLDIEKSLDNILPGIIERKKREIAAMGQPRDKEGIERLEEIQKEQENLTRMQNREDSISKEKIVEILQKDKKQIKRRIDILKRGIGNQAALEKYSLELIKQSIGNSEKDIKSVGKEIERLQILEEHEQEIAIIEGEGPKLQMLKKQILQEIENMQEGNMDENIMNIIKKINQAEPFLLRDNTLKPEDSEVLQDIPWEGDTVKQVEKKPWNIAQDELKQTRDVGGIFLKNIKEERSKMQEERSKILGENVEITKKVNEIMEKLMVDNYQPTHDDFQALSNAVERYQKNQKKENKRLDQALDDIQALQDKIEDISIEINLDSIRIGIEENFSLNEKLRGWLTEHNEAKMNTLVMVLGTHTHKHNIIALSFNDVADNFTQDDYVLQQDEVNYQGHLRNIEIVKRNLERVQQANKNNETETSSSSKQEQ